jgi:hypothetical protein
VFNFNRKGISPLRSTPQYSLVIDYIIGVFPIILLFSGEHTLLSLLSTYPRRTPQKIGRTILKQTILKKRFERIVAVHNTGEIHVVGLINNVQKCR